MNYQEESRGCFNCKYGEDTKDGKIKCTIDNNKVHEYNYLCSLWQHILK